jgi:hypothetical protein
MKNVSKLTFLAAVIPLLFVMRFCISQQIQRAPRQYFIGFVGQDTNGATKYGGYIFVFPAEGNPTNDFTTAQAELGQRFGNVAIIAFTPIQEGN